MYTYVDISNGIANDDADPIIAIRHRPETLRFPETAITILWDLVWVALCQETALQLVYTVNVGEPSYHLTEHILILNETQRNCLRAGPFMIVPIISCHVRHPHHPRQLPLRLR